MVEEARAYHPDRQIDLRSEPRLPAHFDKSRMEQVISNLIGNAIKHGEQDRPVTVSLAAQDGFAQLSVHNEGLPIAEDIVSSIFNPMVRHLQGDKTEYGAGAGLGLGLYIASAIIKAHGGTIEVISKTGTGTTFTVRIPLKRLSD
jgi:signal transduction histidine kinase